MTRKLLWIAGTALLVLVCISGWLLFRRTKIVVSKETTYFTGPLRPDGTVDYVRALNDRYSAGVTADTNAAVLLFQIIGPEPDRVQVPFNVFSEMGMSPPLGGVNTLVPLNFYLEALKKSRDDIQKMTGDELAACLEAPWKAADHQDIADWLESSEKALQLVPEAVRRPDYFVPLWLGVDDKGRTSPLVNCLLPHVQQYRTIARALVARAMLEIAEGNPQAAWQDISNCHRLGRVISQNGCLIQRLVGIAIETQAMQAESIYLREVDHTADEFRAKWEEIAAIPPIADTAEPIEVFERCMMLDTMRYLAQGGQVCLGGFHNTAILSPNWNTVMRFANQTYDRLIAALAISGRNARQMELENIEKQLRDEAGKEAHWARVGLGKGPFYVSLFAFDATSIGQAEVRVAQRLDNLQVAFALQIYRAEQGDFPESLAELVPKYLPELPVDRFAAGAPLQYRRTPEEVLFYSVGGNEKDDGGQTNNQPPGSDDIVVRFRRPQPVPPSESPE